MEEIRVNTIQECLQQTTKMIAASEKKQTEQIQNLEHSIEAYKTEFSTSTMQIMEMLSTMRREQKDNHISYLKETKSLRESAHTSTPTSQNSIVSYKAQISPHSAAHAHNAQNDKKRVVEYSENQITPSPEKRAMMNNIQNHSESPNETIPYNESDV